MTTYIESKLNPDGTYDHSEVIEAYRNGAKVEYFKNPKEYWLPCEPIPGDLYNKYRAVIEDKPEQPAAIEPPWDDLKLAYSVNWGTQIWEQVDAINKLVPNGWELMEMTDACCQYMVIFRVDVFPTVADGEEVKAILADFDKE